MILEINAAVLAGCGARDHGHGFATKLVATMEMMEMMPQLIVEMRMMRRVITEDDMI